MKQAKTLVHKITNHSRIFDETLRIYNEALTYVIDVIDCEFDDLSIHNKQSITKAVEQLIHRTVKNPVVKYVSFDEQFYKFPSYLRRAAIIDAFGKVKSFRTLYKKWLEQKEHVEACGKRFSKKPPTKQYVHKQFPVLYKNNMFVRTSETTARIKAFVKNDWIWIDVNIKKQSAEKRRVVDWTQCNPMLVRKGKKYFLHITYEKNIQLNQTHWTKQNVCAVDLGLTNSAVCSIVNSDGTVLARKFINQAREKDRYATMVNKLKKAQRLSGVPIQAPRYWNRLNGLRKFIRIDTATQIIRFAKEHGAHVIVCEYLGNMNVHGAKRLRCKLHHWDKRAIQQKVREMAHYEGMRFTTVNPKNTSSLAFDGSGKVKRVGRKDIAIFSTGKQYHADLNASYNIAARYFIRQMKKSMSETNWLRVATKASPHVGRTTICTLSSLIALRKVYATV